MEIKLWSLEDFEIGKDSEIFGCGLVVNSRDYLSATTLYDYLTNEEGVSLINSLRAQNGMIVLCQVRDPSGLFEFARVVISGNGLMLQNVQAGVAIFEHSVSCLFASFVWRIHKKTFNAVSYFFSNN